MKEVIKIEGNPNAPFDFWTGESIAFIEYRGAKIDQSYLFITQGNKAYNVLCYEILINTVKETTLILEYKKLGILIFNGQINLAAKDEKLFVILKN